MLSASIDVSEFRLSYLLPVFVFSLLLTGMAGAASAPAGINIFVVDSNNKAFNAEVVRWWYAGKRNKKFELKCLNQQCDKRLLKKKWIGPIVISADSSTVEPEDTSCWKLYHGEVLLDSPAEKVEIVMHYKSHACK